MPLTASPDLPVLDEARLAELSTMLGPVLDEVMRAWLNDTPRTLDALREALRRGDAATAAGVAHALKGSCSNVGAARVCAAAQSLEHDLRSNEADCAAASVALARLDDEYDNAVRLITHRFEI